MVGLCFVYTIGPGRCTGLPLGAAGLTGVWPGAANVPHRTGARDKQCTQ